MTVYENLEMGASTRPREPEFDHDLARVLILFAAGRGAAAPDPRYLAGGEQQMVAIGALMARPKLLCMDEPSMGLSPAYVERSTSSERSTGRALRSLLSSRTPTWHCQSPTVLMCCRPDGSC